MILGNISQLPEYRVISPNLSRAIDYICSHISEFSTINPGRYEIDENMFYVVFDYSPKYYTELKLESHKEYIDIQIILRGNEKIGINYLKDQTPSSDDVKNDLYFYDIPIYKIINMNEGDFAILFPSDLHMPGILSSELTVKKLVFKVAL